MKSDGPQRRVEDPQVGAVLPTDVGSAARRREGTLPNEKVLAGRQGVYEGSFGKFLKWRELGRKSLPS